MIHHDISLSNRRITMFGRHLVRHWHAPWQSEETEQRESHEESGCHHRRLVHGHDRPHGHHGGHGRHPFFAWRDDAAAWFSPRGPHRFGPFGRGGPFGEDPFDEDGGGRRRQRRGDIKYVLQTDE